MQKNERKPESNNPQSAVINNLLELNKKVQENIEILIKGPPPPKNPIIEAHSKAIEQKQEKINDILEKDEINDSDSLKIEELDFQIRDLESKIKQLKINQRVTQLEDRHLALIKILTHDNYFRNINQSTMSTLEWIVSASRECLDDGDLQDAYELTVIYENKMYQIFKETYPNNREFMFQLLEAIKYMKIIPLGNIRRAPGYDNEYDDLGI